MEAKDYKKIGNTHYHIEFTKKTSFEKFALKKSGLINTDLKKTYEQITGKTVTKDEYAKAMKTVKDTKAKKK